MSCSHKNELFHRFCSSCGESLKRTVCHCGAANAEPNMFCYSCGHDLLKLKDSRAQLASEQPGSTSRKPSLSKLLGSSEVVDPSGQSDKDAVSQSDINALFGKRGTDEH